MKKQLLESGQWRRLMQNGWKRALTSLLLVIVAMGLGLYHDAQADTLFLPSTIGPTADRVFRYDLRQASTTLTLTLQTQAPTGMVIAPWGELFVANHSFLGSISRFFDPLGTPLPNGTISGAGLSSPEEMLFRGQELFVVNPGGFNVLRFTFDALRNAIPNGAISQNLSEGVRGIVYNPATDELFVSVHHQNRIYRYIFDEAGNASPNGSIDGNGLSSPHGMTFTTTGELLVANYLDNSISRFTFTIDGNATANGIITGNDLSGPIDVAFSSFGELFVTNNRGTVSRFIFNETGAAAPNGTFTSAALYLNWMLIVPESSPDDLIEAVCPQGATYRNHGAYVSCVSNEAERLFASGVITEFEKDAIVAKAGRSDVGKRLCR